MSRRVPRFVPRRRWGWVLTPFVVLLLALMTPVLMFCRALDVLFDADMGAPSLRDIWTRVR